MGGRGKSVLVIVHPGSACGSADFNLGSTEAAEARYALGRTIHNWQGPAVVLNNEFKGELSFYAQIGLALSSLRDPIEVDACASDPRWTEIARSTLTGSAGEHFVLTGAWHHPADRSGCIDAVSGILDEEGLDWEIAPCAFRL